MAWLHLFQVRKAELQLLCGLFMPQASIDARAYYVWLLCVDTCVLAVMAVCRDRCSFIALVSSLMPTCQSQETSQTNIREGNRQIRSFNTCARLRPDYKKLGVLKQQFPDVPIMALTATATKRVCDDLKTMLRIEACESFSASINRPNLLYEVTILPPSSAFGAQLHGSCCAHCCITCNE